MIVAKAVNMAEKMDVPVLGVVENLSYVECPDCGKKIEVFGHSRLDEVAAAYNLDILGRLPINPAFAASCDAGTLEDDLPAGMLPEAVAAIQATAEFLDAKAALEQEDVAADADAAAPAEDATDAE